MWWMYVYVQCGRGEVIYIVGKVTNKVMVFAM